MSGESILNAPPSTARSDAPELQAEGRSLLWHGALMTLLGLLSGITTLFAKAPSAALSAHLIGVVQGALLFGLAAGWPLLRASGGTRRAVRVLLLTAVYANWTGTQLAALWSAKGMFVVTGAGMPAGAAGWMEAIVAVLLLTSALAIPACILILRSVRNLSRP